MDIIKYVSGEELVAKGATKQNATLPEIGLKDVVPNGSWLEQKQIQSALEDRKQLIEVQRIEKCGFLSQAEWREDIQLAEVTRQCGGHWQYLGHHRDKQIYLQPEEALFLIEVNCLKLTYNEVTVSLQQAYSLLLRGKITLLKYKVYASLSRLGYKIYRHKINLNLACDKGEIEENIVESSSKENVGSEMEVDCISTSDKVENSLREDCDNIIVQELFVHQDTDHNPETTNSKTESINTEINEPSTSKSQPQRENKVLSKIKKLSKRNIRTLNYKKREKFFELIPDFTKSQVLTIEVPEETFLPRNIFLHNLNYKIDLQQLKNRPRIVQQTRRYSASDLNGPEIRRIRNSSVDSTSMNDNFNANNFNTNPFQMFPRFFQNRFMFQNRHPYNFRSFPFQRPPNYHFLLNYLIQRPYQQFSVPHFVRQQTPFFRQPRFFSMNQMQHEDRRRKRSHEDIRLTHLGAIKRLSLKLKKIIAYGFRREDNVNALKNLITTYNAKYGCVIHLNENFDLMIDNNLVETIDLENEEVSPRKKQKSNNDSKLYEEYLNLLNKLAIKLKISEEKGESTSKLRRGFSNLVKKFNKSFNADAYLESDYKVYDKNNVVIDLSDSETVSNEVVPKIIKNKLVRNPFSIKHKKTQTKISPEPSTTQETSKHEELRTIFGDQWLPKETDFGTALIAQKTDMQNQILTSHNELYIYEFLKSCAVDFENWNSAKISFWENTEFLPSESHDDNFENDTSIDSIVKPDDCKDMASVLEKLRIIKHCDFVGETNLRVVFDVFNRDVQNFRKSNKPLPHFRIVCVDAAQDFPSIAEISSLHASYKDKIPIVFAVVIHDAISYIQMNPADIPVYIPSCELP